LLTELFFPLEGKVFLQKGSIMYFSHEVRFFPAV
jgi:hypothetical protein